MTDSVRVDLRIIMSELNEVDLPAGPAAEVHVPPVGPLESRRSRRERSEAAAAALSLPIASVAVDSSLAHPIETTVVFSDELAAAPRQRLLGIPHSESMRVPSEDWIS
ncbi:MAG: hypothetical protein CVT64_07495 [Actinobacteria bacterium HGW-Actinobacteria-4]|nr:MAG: hypothetical protein CVT64_07495 [Actinobacteria bacterium HGW-Actinobacteria-4]